MSKFRDKLLIERLKKQHGTNSKNAALMLKKIWGDLPSDVTFGERSLFIEIAERLIKVEDINKDNYN